MHLQWSSTDLRGSEDSSIKRRFLGSCEEGDRGYCERKNGNGEREYWDSKSGGENYTKWSEGEEVKEKQKTEWECVNAETESYLTEIVKRYIQLNKEHPVVLTKESPKKIRKKMMIKIFLLIAMCPAP